MRACVCGGGRGGDLVESCEYSLSPLFYFVGLGQVWVQTEEGTSFWVLVSWEGVKHVSDIVNRQLSNTYFGSSSDGN